MKQSWQNFSFGVVWCLIGYLFYQGFTSISNNLGQTYFILSCAIILLIFSSEVFFSKRTDNTLKEIKQDVKEIKQDMVDIKEALNKIAKNEPTVYKEKSEPST